MITAVVVVLLNWERIVRWFMQRPFTLWEDIVFGFFGSLTVGWLCFFVIDRPYRIVFAVVEKELLELRERRAQRKARESKTLTADEIRAAAQKEEDRLRLIAAELGVPRGEGQGEGEAVEAQTPVWVRELWS